MLNKLDFYRFLSLNVWGNLPSPIQRGISKTYTSIYNKKISKHFIQPYCKANYSDPNYLDQFRPASGAEDYQSFQDFSPVPLGNPSRLMADPSGAVKACSVNQEELAKWI